MYVTSKKELCRWHILHELFTRAVQRMPRGTSSRWFYFRYQPKKKNSIKKIKEPATTTTSLSRTHSRRKRVRYTQKEEVPSPPRWARKYETIEDEPRFKGLVETLTLKVSSRRNRRSSSQNGETQDTVFLC